MEQDPSRRAPGPLGFEIPTPMTAAPRRPGLLTAAAVLLFVFGGLGLVAGVWLLAGSQDAAVSLGPDQAKALGLLPVAIGVFYVAAGIGVVRLRPAGLTMGAIAAAVMLVTSVFRLRTDPGSALTGLVVAGFVVFALASHAPLLRISHRR